MVSEEEFRNETLTIEKLYHNLLKGDDGGGISRDYLVLIALERLRAEVQRAVAPLQALSQTSAN